MTVATKDPESDVDLSRGSTIYWATELPELRPAMLLPRMHPKSSAFPFNAANVQYVHFARNAIYHLAKQMALSGQEVLVPAFFHGVELEALLAAGIRPRFFPVRQGMRVEPEDVIAAITPQTRAIYLIHYAGFPGPAAAVQTICRERGLLFIEDCALALLSQAGGQPLGSFGDAAVFCLYKTLPTPDGGAVIMREGCLKIDYVAPSSVGTARVIAAAVLTYLEKRGGTMVKAFARSIKSAGKAATRPGPADWVDVGTQNFDIDDVNLAMSSIAHRILASQDLDAIVDIRRRNYLHLQSLLGNRSPPIFDSLPEGTCPLFYPYVTQHKLKLWRRLRSEGVQSVLFWLGGELGPEPGQFPEVDDLRRTVLELPCHQDMTPDGIERVACIVREFERGLGAK